MEQKSQQFNDGVVNLYTVKNISPPGKAIKQGLTIKVGPLRYEERVVGMSRFMMGMQNQVSISQMLRLPRNNEISTQDVAIPIDGKQYEIIQVQYPPNIEPPCMDLSLKKVVAKYEIV